MSHRATHGGWRGVVAAFAALGSVAFPPVGTATAATAPDPVVASQNAVAQLPADLAAGDLLPALHAHSIDDAVAAVVTVVGAAFLAWYVISALAFLVCTTAAAAGRRWRAGEALLERWGAPMLRRTAVAVIGVVVSTGVGATAAAGAGAPAPPLPDDLRWSATQHRVDVPAGSPLPGEHGPAGNAAETPADVAGDPAGSPGEEAEPRSFRTHLVRPGESLWSIAAAHLRQRGVDPTDPLVAAEWPRWYSTNADTVGSDPHLIHPGQELLAP